MVFKTPNKPPSNLLKQPNPAKLAKVVKNLAKKEIPITTSIKVKIKAAI